MIFNLLSPLTIMTFTIFLSSIFKCSDRKFQIFDRNRMIALFIITIWLVQPDVAHILIASLGCRDIEGKQRLLYDPDIICWEGIHLDFIMMCTIPGILIYMVLLPLLFLFLIYRNRQNFKDFKRINEFRKM